jgi:hypothetical protein
MSATRFASSRRATERILTRHFLRCFLENDLIAPDADRAQTLAVAGATLLTSTIFISVFMGWFKYVVGYYTPGELAISALDDRFFYIALSMLVLALLAAIQWDALVIDVRDAAILEPLPVPAASVRRAKLAAVAILGLAAAVAVNVVPTVVFPLLLLIKQPISIVSAVVLMVIHACVTLAAAAFAYLAVIAFRETLSALLGPRWFARVSPWVQGGLVIVLGSSLLLLPPAATRVQRDLDGTGMLSPPAWFLGAYEVAAGGIIADAPRTRLTARQLRADRTAIAIYRQREADFARLARRGVAGLVFVTMLAAGAYAWNARRMPSLAPGVPVTRRRRQPLIQAMLSAVSARDFAARAGFFFALAVMWRSRTHRLTLACAAAVGLAVSIVSLSGVDLQNAAGGAFAPTRLLAVQPLFIGALLIGFRHAIRVPAELRASWGVQTAWHGQERQFVSGVRRAALAGLAVPLLVAMLPLFVFTLGARIALLHAALGFAGALVFLEALLLNYAKVPFTCTYVPNENIKALGPIYAIGFLIGASVWAGMERAALQEISASVRLLVLLALIFIVLRRASLRRPRVVPVDFNEVPTTTQRLGLRT